MTPNFSFNADALRWPLRGRPCAGHLTLGHSTQTRAMKALVALIATALTGAAIAQRGDLAALELHYGRESRVSERQQAALQSATLRLLRSSNFNSERHRD